jgi:hypothetical protein
MNISNPVLIQIPEPELLFGYGQRMAHPKDGLLLFGPSERHSSGGKLSIGVISTPKGLKHYSTGVAALSKSIPPLKPNDQNHTIFPGFQALFGVDWPSEPATWLSIDEEELARVIRMTDRYQGIHKAVSLYSDAITLHLREESDSSIDLWIIVVPEDVYLYCRPKSIVEKSERKKSDFLMNKTAATRLLQEPGLFEEDNATAELYLYELDFHNQLKARLLHHKVAVQVIRETTLAPNDFIKDNGRPLRGLQDPATLAWNLATTCYFKAGGKPWQLSTTRRGVCYVGIVFKKDFSSPVPGNACCGAQMFLESGDGVVFRGAVGPWITQGKDDYHLPKEKARTLMSKVVDAYRSKHNGESPKELFIHGKTRFSKDEWDGFRETVPEDCNVVCIRIREDSGLKLFRHGVTNIARGLGWIKSPWRAYLWTKGYVPRLQTYAGREVPNPLSIEICRGEANIKQVLTDILALTKLNYNACIYGDGVPVTLRFADTVGDILTAAPRSAELPPLPFRYYI